MAKRSEGTPIALFIGRSAWSEHGGIQRFNRRVAQALQDSISPTTTLMLGDAHRDVPNDVTPNTFKGFGGSYWRFLKTYISAASKSDILFIGHINYLPFAIIFKMLRKKGKVVLFAHGVEVWDDIRYRRKRFYEPAMIRSIVDKIAIVSGYSQKLMAAGYAISREKFVIFPNAVDICDKSTRGQRTSNNVLVVARLGSGEAEKHVDKVILAFAKVLTSLPTATLTIIGDGELRPMLEALAKDLGISGSVVFEGFVDETRLSEAYSKASVFALPSSKEGFGIVYLEAWLQGIPVVASRFGAAPEVVSDGIDGYTVNPSDVQELAQRLVDLLVNKGKASDFAVSGLEKIKSTFSNEAFRLRLDHLINS